MQPSTEPFSISRTFAAPRTAIFAALTEPERMRQWWGPKGCTVIAANMDLRPGGTYHYGLRTPDGGSMWGKFVYREILAPERIVLVNSFSDEAGGVTRHPMSANWPLRMVSTFLVTEQDGRATLRVSWVPLDATPEECATFDAARAGMAQGWNGTLDQLEAYLAKP